MLNFGIFHRQKELPKPKDNRGQQYNPSIEEIDSLVNDVIHEPVEVRFPNGTSIWRYPMKTERELARERFMPW